MHAVLETGVFEVLVSFLDDLYVPYPTIIRETLWIFINILAVLDGEEARMIKDTDLKDRFVGLVSMNDHQIVENVSEFEGFFANFWRKSEKF